MSALTPDDLPSDLTFAGAPAAYWVDLINRDPVETAQSLDLPFMILQGERDYQVTMDDFAVWQDALTGDNATFISYPALNHIFTTGEGPGSPADYAVAGNVPQEVITDIVNWIGTVTE